MRDFNEKTATDGVLKSFQAIKDQRLKESHHLRLKK